MLEAKGMVKLHGSIFQALMDLEDQLDHLVLLDHQEILVQLGQQDHLEIVDQPVQQGQVDHLAQQAIEALLEQLAHQAHRAPLELQGAKEIKVLRDLLAQVVLLVPLDHLGLLDPQDQRGKPVAVDQQGHQDHQDPQVW
jgi:hypothetical protein